MTERRLWLHRGKVFFLVQTCSGLEDKKKYWSHIYFYLIICHSDVLLCGYFSMDERRFNLECWVGTEPGLFLCSDVHRTNRMFSGKIRSCLMPTSIVHRPTMACHQPLEPTPNHRQLQPTADCLRLPQTPIQAATVADLQSRRLLAAASHQPLEAATTCLLLPLTPAWPPLPACACQPLEPTAWLPLPANLRSPPLPASASP